MRRRNAASFSFFSFLSLSFLLALAIAAAACDPVVDPPVATSLAVVSGDAQQAEVGAALDPLVVEVSDQNGDPMAGVQVGWQAAAGSVVAGSATDSDGRTSAAWTLGTSVGEQTVTASIGDGRTVTFTATAVAGALATLTVSPDTLAFAALGDTASVSATGADAHGNDVTFTATWTSRDSTVAAVDAQGGVEAKGNGATWIVAASGDLRDSTRVTVEQEAVSVALSPAMDTVAVGASVTFTAEAHDANGHVLSGAAFTWATLDAAIATVADGVVEGVGAGTTTITASLGSVADSAQVTVELALDSDLIGEWVSTKVLFQDPGNPARMVEVELSEELYLYTFRADGSFTYWEQFSDGTIDQDAGSWSVTGDTLEVHLLAEDSTSRFGYTKSGAGAFSFSFTEPDGYDFDEDGTGDPTLTTLVNARTTDLPELVGTWSSHSVVAVNLADSSQSADLTSDLSVTVTFRSDGTHSAVVTEGGITEVDTGWYLTTEGTLWLVEGDIVRMTLDIQGDTATVSFDDTIDFEDDGIDENARFTIRFGPGGGTVGGEIDPDLVGHWAGISYVLENQYDSSQQVDMVVEEGMIMELTLYEDGTFVSKDTDADGDVTWSDAGTWHTRADTIVWSPHSTTDSLLIPYAKDGLDLFAFETTGQEGYDFDGDGIDEPTHEFGLMARRIDAQLLGTWVAESGIIVNPADTTQWVDFVAEGGSLTATFHGDGSLVVDQVEPDLQDRWDMDGEHLTFTGRYLATQGSLWFVEQYGTNRLLLSLDGDVATVSSEYYSDIENNGTEQLVVETIVLRRQ